MRRPGRSSLAAVRGTAAHGRSTPLTGSGSRGDGPMHENTHLDLAYVRRVRLTTDCKILLHTIPALMGRRTGF